MKQSQINIYSPFPLTEKVSLSKYKAFIEESIDKHGIKWIYRRKTTNSSLDSNGQPTAKRGKKSKYAWVILYECHRAGSKKINLQQPKGGQSGKQRPIQKESKKINCQAKLHVSCPYDDPDNVIIEHVGHHNHRIGSIEDLKYLPKSKRSKAAI
ncbi:MAG: hypothetical protein EXX96DRAFT_493128 [Benjaminiella poitrasii]|nr:MAG: hypothetical protein EXX96DRAFT_493128 [Benjaminiella poitrasii]